ncbi:oligoribonuclease [Peribacillus cavernae]|uniref:Oligoribonuclease n=1 Tax=Peribacillus cavernae TaxID=1674310 RepID=A0A433HB63_9BACI|nr:DHHA1 domain-containing protein [Peribacillus cavernae]MDQ0220357.1 oligoribonuclease NrnB/cAMP/cGMP phosphodiesterase (DHH superfamily) [Peribacillus cavernae]RUQ25551.1 oligoribonuclease [Peribacillus cavernae]
MYRLLTHNDLDGVSCGILAKLALKGKVDVSYNSISALNHQVEAFLEKGDPETELLITDLSVNEENEKRISEFVAAGGHVKLIDHHKSAEHLNQYNWAAVTVTQTDGKQASATSLFFEYLLQRGLLDPTATLTEFIELVRQYDTWEWDKNNNITSKQLNDLFFMFSINEFEEKLIHKLTNNTAFLFDEIEQKLLNVEENRVERYIVRKKREVYQINIGNHLAGIVHAESYHSELGNELSKEFPHLDYIAIIMVGSKRISLRTIHDEVDVSEVAAKYDGGGHQKASGCNLTPKAFQQFVEKTYHSEPLKRDAFKNKYNTKESERGCLYNGKHDENIFIYLEESRGWFFDFNEKKENQMFSSFGDIEKHIKRKYSAYLVRDDKFVDYLLKYHSKMKKNKA